MVASGRKWPDMRSVTQPSSSAAPKVKARPTQIVSQGETPCVSVR